MLAACPLYELLSGPLEYKKNQTGAGALELVVVDRISAKRNLPVIIKIMLSWN
jgi:hypothetical protein